MRPSEALKAAKQLVGLWPHAKPPDAETYMTGLAAVLQQYPPVVIRECIDPRTGLARKREFPPTPASIIEWCDNRLAFYQSLSSYVPPPPPRIEKQFSEEHCAEMRRRIGELPKLFHQPAAEQTPAPARQDQAEAVG